jgi:uncharacterized protein
MRTQSTQSIPFAPLPLLKSGWKQTVVSALVPQKALTIVDQSHKIDLPDGDRLILLDTAPLVPRPHPRGVLIVHGLTGSAHSSDTSRLGLHLRTLGYHIFRLNLRNCGDGLGLAQGIYHSGRSEDTRAAILKIKELYPNLPITQIGFSLGGNITLKMAGEDGSFAAGNLDSIIAISPPADLSASSRRLGEPQNKLFNQYFVRRLLKDVHAIYGLRRQAPPLSVAKIKTLFEFDEYFTAPQGGFHSAEHYYAESSSLHKIANIKLPTLIVTAHDDPVVDSSALKSIPYQPNHTLHYLSHGGHCAFLAKGYSLQQNRWLDHLISNWMQEQLS